MKKLLIILLSICSLTSFAQTDKLVRRISYELGKVEGSFPQINMLIKKGEKVQAREMVNAALLQIEKIEEKQKEASLIGDVDEEDLFIPQTQEAKRFLINKANQLRNGINVYIHCNAQLFKEEYRYLTEEIQGYLSEIGCAFVDSIESADWAIYIDAKTREGNKMTSGKFTTFFSYVDLRLSIDKTANGKRVYQNSFSEKGGDTRSFEQAAYEAYHELTPQVSAIIKEHIQQ